MNMFKRIFAIFLLAVCSISMVACSKKDKTVSCDKDPTQEKCQVSCEADPTQEKCQQTCEENPNQDKCTPVIPIEDIVIGIEGPSEVKSGKSITLKANVSGTSNKEVTWSITGNTATISDKGVVTAKEVTSDSVVTVTATSVQDTKFSSSTQITVTGKPELTQEMLDEIDNEAISFDGVVKISLYTIGLFPSLYNTYDTTVHSAMNGVNWYAEYTNGSTGLDQGLYIKNKEDVACVIGLSFTNEEQYNPIKNDDGSIVSWEQSGYYNSLTGLKLSDFTFNEDTWRYEYDGMDENLASKVLASANPYDFDPTNLALIIEGGSIIGIYSKSNPSYTIQAGYSAIQELTAFITLGEDVEVPTITKYTHDEMHEPLQEAIENTRAFGSYVTDFQSYVYSIYTSSADQTGYTEYVSENDCYFKAYTVKNVQGEAVKNYTENGDYGYKKISDSLYNSYYYDSESKKYVAGRAYNADFSNAKPSLEFAAEIFTRYYVDSETGETTYYVDKPMSAVASRFYYGVGNDIALYGLFATEMPSSTAGYTPYVTVKDGHIVETGFYFNLYYMYGIVEINYSNFDENIGPDKEITFETRQVPSSWDQLTVIVSGDTDNTEDDFEMNALEYFKGFFESDEIANSVPFFGEVLGDTYSFGITRFRIVNGSSKTVKTINFYYDVPLDDDYSIESSLIKIDTYLLSLGYQKKKNGEYTNGTIVVYPEDSNLDLFIYVWKA